MRKLIAVCAALFILSFAAVGSAAKATGPSVPTSQKITECYQKVWQGAEGRLTKVGVIYLNRAQTTYDDDIDYKVLEAVVKGVAPQDHVFVDGTPSLQELEKIGINDLTLAERGDIIGTLRDQGLDYAVLVQVNPFLRKERVAMFRYTIEMTSDITVKLVDVKADRYLYNTKLVRMAKHGTAVAGVSNRSTVGKVLDLVCPELTGLIATRIPKG